MSSPSQKSLSKNVVQLVELRHFVIETALLLHCFEEHLLVVVPLLLLLLLSMFFLRRLLPLLVGIRGIAIIVPAGRVTSLKV